LICASTFCLGVSGFGLEEATSFGQPATAKTIKQFSFDGESHSRLSGSEQMAVHARTMPEANSSINPVKSAISRLA
jgi:hypothetical protein